MFSSSGDGTKGARTRARIREIALASFKERGYDETTVRFIAQEAEVSVGVLNYHFPSKNHLVQELYLDACEELRERASERMDGVTDLVDRLRIAYETGLDVLQPFHEFAPEYLAAAISPRSPINPLSGDSEAAMSGTSAVFQDAVHGAKHRLPAEIAELLPEALTVAFLLLMQFFTYDRSPGQKNSRALITAALGLLGPALPLLRVPAIRKPVRELLDLVAQVRS